MSKNKENYQIKKRSIWDCGGVLLFSRLCCFVVFWLFGFARGGGVSGRGGYRMKNGMSWKFGFSFFRNLYCSNLFDYLNN